MGHKPEQPGLTSALTLLWIQDWSGGLPRFLPTWFFLWCCNHKGGDDEACVNRCTKNCQNADIIFSLNNCSQGAKQYRITVKSGKYSLEPTLFYFFLMTHLQKSSEKHYVRDCHRVDRQLYCIPSGHLNCACRHSSFFRASSVVFDTALHFLM